MSNITNEEIITELNKRRDKLLIDLIDVLKNDIDYNGNSDDGYLERLLGELRYRDGNISGGLISALECYLDK